MPARASAGDHWLPAALVHGFGAALAMWCVGYVTHLPGLAPTSAGGKAVVGMCLIAAFGSVLGLLGGAAPRERLVRAGLVAGLLAGSCNLMILGSVLSEPPAAGGSAPVPNAGAMALGFLGASGVAGVAFAWLGGVIAPGWSRLRASTDRWHARLAVLAALGVVPVLLTGGLVTSHEAGLAVPDWPNSYTANMFLYPLSKMTGGIYYEHMHRLFGALAGLGCLLLFVFSLARMLTGRRAGRDAPDAPGAAAPGTPALRRGWASWLAGLALTLITIQGLLGGLRVIAADGSTDVSQWKDQARETVYSGRAETANFALTVDNTTSINLALAHGVSGQLTFVFIAIAAAMVSPAWTRARERARRSAERGDGVEALPRDGLLRWCAGLLFASAVVQLIFGAAVRHHESVLMLFVHITMGSLLVLFAAVATFRMLSRHGDDPTLRRTAKWLLGVVLAQFALGWVAMFAAVPHYGGKAGSGTGLTTEQPVAAVLGATAHQALGAFFLALCGLTFVWSLRLTASRAAAQAYGEEAVAAVPHDDASAPPRLPGSVATAG